MSGDCGLRGLDLLDAAISQIEQHPETWHQGSWRCGAGMCLAGHIATLAGARWPYPETNTTILPGPNVHERREVVAAEPEDDPSHVMFPDDFPVIPVVYRAERLLGFEASIGELLDDPDDDRDLFEGFNDLSDIRTMRDDLRARLRAGEGS
jgi:hypothetical protein